MCSDKTAIALLKSKQICSLAALLKTKDLLSDILKSSQTLNQADSIRLCDCICKIRCNDCLNKSSILWQSLLFLNLADCILSKQASRHISCQRMILTSLCILYIYAKTVCIRICCQNKICVFLLCKCKCQFKCFCCLWIWIAYSRELSIWKLLLWNYINMSKAKLL